MNPDCRDGKHASCSGDGWHLELDKVVDCPCDCHALAAALTDPEGRSLVQAIHDRKAEKEGQ